MLQFQFHRISCKMVIIELHRFFSNRIFYKYLIRNISFFKVMIFIILLQFENILRVRAFIQSIDQSKIVDSYLFRGTIWRRVFFPMSQLSHCKDTRLQDRRSLRAGTSNNKRTSCVLLGPTILSLGLTVLGVFTCTSKHTENCQT